tara:strand:- start:507 stop:656 length:150 start_codon:yes stop_codon:yes gene_type:complete
MSCSAAVKAHVSSFRDQWRSRKGIAREYRRKCRTSLEKGRTNPTIIRAR